ncbi:phosphatase PAP2 family protein [Nonomuraea dietziae]|uniref:phosphatase PAP2 family protein n=1 Tax=Nonomuraea dietziae TaxID=65515 RepID=UPI00340808F6
MIDSTVGSVSRSTPTLSAGRSARLAAALSALLNPTAVAVVLPVGIGAVTAGVTGALWGLVPAVFTGILPTMYARRLDRIAQQGHGGKSPRQLWVAFASLTVGLAVLILAGAPHAVLVANVGLLAVLLVITPITLLWDISIHAATIAGAAAFAVLALTPGAAATVGLALVVAVVGWSRLKLGKHQPTQVIAGTALGALACGLVYTVLADQFLSPSGGGRPVS